ncbi:MAG: Gldg family protein [Treponema sp.]|nr:Gldg family protein [Treponema sp.]
MKNIFKIHFYRLFSSRMRYILSAVFSAACAVFFFARPVTAQKNIQLALHTFFLFASSLFIIYIPFVTSASSFSESEEAMFPSSAVSSVLGKFSACMLFFFLTLISLFCVPGVILCISDADIKTVFLEITGLIFYAALSFSFCIYIFTLFKKHSLSFAVSTGFLLLVNSFHLMPYFEKISFMYPLINFFSTVWHFESFSKGILDTRDIIFFTAFTALFILLSVFESENQKGKKFTAKIKVMLLLFIVLITFDSKFFYKRIDFSSSHKYTVGTLSRSYIDLLDENLEITFYRSENLFKREPSLRDVSDYLYEYASCSEKIFYSEKDPYKSSDKNFQARLSAYGIYPQPLLSQDGAGQYEEVYSAVVLSYLGNTEVIPFLLSSDTLEYDLTLRLEHLITQRARTVQIVQSGNLAPENSYAVPLLEHNGFTVAKTFLPSEASETLLPFTDFINVPLIVFGSENFSKKDTKALEKFILNGGRAFIASSPFSVNESDWKITEGEGFFERMLFTFGIYYENKIVSDTDSLKILFSSETNAMQKESFLYPLWPVIPEQKNAPEGMTLFWPSCMTLDEDVASIVDFTVEPYLTTSKTSWLTQKKDGELKTNPFFVQKEYEPGTQKGPFTVAAAVKKDRQIRAIVFSSPLSLVKNSALYSQNSAPDLRTASFLCDSVMTLSGYSDFVELKNNRVKVNKTVLKLSKHYAETAVLVSALIILINLSLGSVGFVYKKRLFK